MTEVIIGLIQSLSYQFDISMDPSKPCDIKKPKCNGKSQKNTKISSKTETAKVFKEFCESTSLHGFPYLFIADSIILRIIWVIVILGMTCLGGYFFVANTNDYLSSGIVTTIESSSASLDVSIYQLIFC